MLTPSQARTVGLIAFLAVIFTLAALMFATTVPAAHAATRCAEDDACWNWATMGNHTRGVITAHGTRVVVGPCTFQRFARAGNLRYWPMRGDVTAMSMARCHTITR